MNQLITLAVMAVIPFTTSMTETEMQNEARERTLADFSDGSAAREWRAVNDNVMGGISTGGPSFEDGRLIFSGETRLENNGGFSSIRSVGKDWKLGRARDVVVRLRGDSSRKYTMRLSTTARRWSMRVSYWQGFELKGDGWQTVRLPLSDFAPRIRGTKLKGPKLDEAKIRSLGFMVYDKKAGPFRLEIDWIKASWADEAPKSAATANDTTANDTTANDTTANDTTANDKADIVGLAQSAGKFATLLTAAQKAGLVDTLKGKGPFTVLAPTDAAFDALPKATLEALLKPDSKDQLRSILLYHVIPGTLTAGELAVNGEAATAQGQNIAFKISGGRVMANGAGIIINDLEATNGIVHAIDRVLLPKPEVGPAQRLMETAVATGSKLFNDGNVDACASIYEMTITAILEFNAPDVDEDARKVLKEALEAARNDEDRRAAAWTLRRAIDRAWAKTTD